MPKVQNFNLRTYGLWVQNGHVLICHEIRNNFRMTKFPGGGIEKGEGITDALKREFLEELNLEIEIQSFFYVNDFLQISAFNEADQLVCFYYGVEPKNANDYYHQPSFAMDDVTFEWIKISEISIDQFTFPIDRVVAENLKTLIM